jgi:hypothetical protein
MSVFDINLKITEQQLILSVLADYSHVSVKQIHSCLRVALSLRRSLLATPSFKASFSMSRVAGGDLLMKRPSNRMKCAAYNTIREQTRLDPRGRT